MSVWMCISSEMDALNAAYAFKCSNNPKRQHELISKSLNHNKIDIEAVMEAVGIVPNNVSELPVLKDLDLPAETNDFATFSEESGESCEKNYASFGGKQCVTSARQSLKDLLPPFQVFRSNLSTMSLPSPPYSDRCSGTSEEAGSTDVEEGMCKGSGAMIYQGQDHHQHSPLTPSDDESSQSTPYPTAIYSSHPSLPVISSVTSYATSPAPGKMTSKSASKINKPKQKRSRPPPDKPTTPYLEMIARALISTPRYAMILGDIYAYIETHYPYYQNAPSTWKNAVRHNLTVNDCFMKTGPSKGGRGFLWAVHPACIDLFKGGNFRRMSVRRAAQNIAKPDAGSCEDDTSRSPSPPQYNAPSPTPYSMPSPQYTAPPQIYQNTPVEIKPEIPSEAYTQFYPYYQQAYGANQLAFYSDDYNYQMQSYNHIDNYSYGSYQDQGYPTAGSGYSGQFVTGSDVTLNPGVKIEARMYDMTVKTEPVSNAAESDKKGGSESTVGALISDIMTTQ